MSSTNVNCPKCGGGIILSNNEGGESFLCPHCSEAIYIPRSKGKSTVLWVTVLVTVVLGACIFLTLSMRNRSKPPATLSEASESPVHTAPSITKEDSSSSGAKSEDELALEKISKEFYRSLNERDFAGLNSILSESSRRSIPQKRLEELLINDPKYTFIDLENVVYKKGEAGVSAAKVKVKRLAETKFKQQEGVKEFKFVLESSGWKMFRDRELAETIVDDFHGGGFSQGLRDKIQILRDNDPFGEWDKNDTNALENIYKNIEEREALFPWHIKFTLKTNWVESGFLNIAFDVKNTSSATWELPSLDFHFKQPGKPDENATVFLSDMRPNAETNGVATVFLKKPLQESQKYALDVYYHDGGDNYLLKSDQSVEFVVVPLTNIVRLDLTKASFERTRSSSDELMWSARIDYRLANISNQPQKDLEIKCVWSLLDGQIINQTSDLVVGYSDLPLQPRQMKVGYINCGVGYTQSKVPVKVDVYFEHDSRRVLIRHGLIIR